MDRDVAELILSVPFSQSQLTRFLTESLAIEGIHREPTEAELKATTRFLTGRLSVSTVKTLQAVYAPGKPIRNKPGMNVRVGRHIPPRGAPDMGKRLRDILPIADPWENHVAFETLHPFMDGNGRTGRAVWAWAMRAAGQDPFILPFLHRFYYQTLQHVGR